MPTQSHIEEAKTGDGSTSEKLVVEFTNGSLQQLRELKDFFDIQDDDPYKVIEFAIGLLESIKQSNTDEKS